MVCVVLPRGKEESCSILGVYFHVSLHCIPEHPQRTDNLSCSSNEET